MPLDSLSSRCFQRAGPGRRCWGWALASPARPSPAPSRGPEASQVGGEATPETATLSSAAAKGPGSCPKERAPPCSVAAAAGPLPLRDGLLPLRDGPLCPCLPPGRLTCLLPPVTPDLGRCLAHPGAVGMQVRWLGSGDPRGSIGTRLALGKRESGSAGPWFAPDPITAGASLLVPQVGWSGWALMSRGSRASVGALLLLQESAVVRGGGLSGPGPQVPRLASPCGAARG